MLPKPSAGSRSRTDRFYTDLPSFFYRRNIEYNMESLVVLREAFIMEVLKVSSHSSPNSVAGAIAGVIGVQAATM